MTPMLEAVALWASAGASGGAGFYALRWFAQFVTGRMDARSDRIDASTDKIIQLLEARVDQLTKRLDTVEQDLVDCKRKHAEAEAKVMRLEARQQGFGEARERAQAIIAAERLEDRVKNL